MIKTDETDPDLVIYGATAEGIAHAARAADEGLRVALVGGDPACFGGFFGSLGAFETHYPGVRSPFLSELMHRIETFYADTYGCTSEQYRVCMDLEADNPMRTFEPSVADAVLRAVLEARPGIALSMGWAPTAVSVEGRMVEAVTFRALDDGAERQIAAPVFADCSYEGDLAALAGVPSLIGREGREVHDEPHAGRIFTFWRRGRFPREAAEGRLNLLPKSSTGELLPGSTGEGDNAVQAYSLRICLCNRLENRIMLTAPPKGYDRVRYAPLALSPEEKLRHDLPFHSRLLTQTLEEMVTGDHVFHGHALPGGKRSWNSTNFPGGGHGWTQADAEGRRAIYRAHVDHALGLMWFLQNDPAVPQMVRDAARPWGLAADEFTDTDHLPPQLYVREARRIVGRAKVIEQDCLIGPKGTRPRTRADSIAITEFPVDSLPCTTDRADDPRSLQDGQFFEMDISRPGQVPWGAVLPEGLDNLVVPVCCSASHAAWGTVRQNPTLMHICEAAAVGVAVAVKAGIAPGVLDGRAVSRQVAKRRMLVSFFNDMDAASDHPAAVAMQVVATLGLCPDFDARPDDRLSDADRAAWESLSKQPVNGKTRGEAAVALVRSIDESVAGYQISDKNNP